jgi:hypothetical protein
VSGWTLKLELWLAAIGRWPLLLALAGVLTAALWAVLLPLAESASTREQFQLAVLGRPAADARPAEPPAPSVDALAEFEQRLASDEDVSRLQRELWRQGASAGLQMNKVDYRNETDANGQFSRLAITLPMTGSYPAVRKFIFSLMADFPGLSLDKLDVKRDQAASGLVETTVHLTLFTSP